MMPMDWVCGFLNLPHSRVNHTHSTINPLLQTHECGITLNRNVLKGLSKAIKSGEYSISEDVLNRKFYDKKKRSYTVKERLLEEKGTKEKR